MTSAEDKANRRKAGRPPNSSANSNLGKEGIFACALSLTKTVPLQEVSIVRVARELNVTPALIHYYIRGRDALTSSVMNAFYRELMTRWPTTTGEWRIDLTIASQTIYQLFLEYPGVAAYAVSQNRFRMIQIVEDGETDYGIQLFESYTAIMARAGFEAYRTGLYAHLLMEFVTTCAYATVRHRWPGEHRKFLEDSLARLDPEKFPNTHFVRNSFANMNPTAAFEEGLRLFLQGLYFEQSKMFLDHSAPTTRS